MIVGKFVSAIILGYLLGSIPSGVLVSKLKAGLDVRRYGSGTMGTTNVLRTVGAKAAATVLLLDVLKGALSVVIAGLLVGGDYLVVGRVGLGALVAQVLAASAALAGHIFPVFVGFRGGKGVATFFGGLAALCPVVAIFGGEVVIIGAGLTRFASLGSMAGAVSAYTILVPLTLFHGFSLELLAYALIGTVVILITHRSNIARLLANKERRLGEKAEKIDSSSTIS